MPVLVGTAGWSIDGSVAASFNGEGTSLQRYASVFPIVEVNSSFHRPHRETTWQRWRDAVPAHFRFSAKMPKTVSHGQRLIDCEGLLDVFLGQVRGLGEKLAILLLQLPPRLEFDPGATQRFFGVLRSRSATQIVLEPRHQSWFGDEADALLRAAHVARVAADPARHPNGGAPGGWRGLSYFRLHGSPVIYRSSYADRIDAYAEKLRGESAEGRPTWCIFDNTASSGAINDALASWALAAPGRAAQE